ncbi:MAG: alpha/beta hydrolase [Deltaproteobacteria bacterium]|nr:alpha/beta hydrolase [Deltaproteobacteria bacterium]
MVWKRARVAHLTLDLAGPEDGPLALCLHGFPDVPSTFHGLGRCLAAQGYRVALPFLPGYAPSPRLARADLESVAGALMALADALCPQRRVVLVGHDWGAAVAYTLAALRPERVAALVSLAVPHPRAFASTWLRSARQRRMSAYMLAFQLPFSALALARDDFAPVGRLWRRWSPGLSVDREHMERVKRCLRQSAGAPLDYYRHGALPLRPALRRLRRLGSVPWQLPTLHLHGMDDGCMSPEAAHASASLLGEWGQIEVLPGVGHFLHLERPEEVEKRVLRFVAQRTRDTG